ncbi:MAG TPA: hypothetical protein VMR70_07435 [Flavisolibacter sp.]|nr:hypothetical protein [Flavisolibacter sp.]
MRVVAILFVVLTLVANFVFNNITSLVVAILSFPVFLWALLKKKKRRNPPPPVSQPANHTEDRFE